MTLPTMVKTERDWAVAPNLRDYAEARRTFSWEGARAELDGLPGGKGLNIAYEAVDRHANGKLRNHVAIRWLGKDGEVRDYRYGQLRELTNRFANVLQGLGVAKGDRVYALSGRIPELYVAALGTLKHRAVFCPLFSAFGPEPIRSRMAIGKAKVLVTTESLYERKVKAIRASLPGLEHILLIGDDHQPTNVADTVDMYRHMQDAADSYSIEETAPEDVALLHFTSGTTGTPKGAVHVHGAVIAHHTTGKLALDFHAEDIFGRNRDLRQQRFIHHAIVAVGVIGRDVALIAQEQERAVPVEGCVLGREESIQTLWGRAARERDGEPAARGARGFAGADELLGGGVKQVSWRRQDLDHASGGHREFVICNRVIW